MEVVSFHSLSIAQSEHRLADKSVERRTTFIQVYLHLNTIQSFTRIRSTRELKYGYNRKYVEITNMALSGK